MSIASSSFAFHISVFFHSLFFTCHWISFVFLRYDRRICTHSVDPSLTHFLGEIVTTTNWDSIGTVCAANDASAAYDQFESILKMTYMYNTDFTKLLL